MKLQDYNNDSLLASAVFIKNASMFDRVLSCLNHYLYLQEVTGNTITEYDVSYEIIHK